MRQQFQEFSFSIKCVDGLDGTKYDGFMVIISILQYGDFDMPYTASLWVGPAPIPKASFTPGMLEEDLVKLLKSHGFSNKVQTQEVTLTDDYMCSSKNESDWSDRRLRVSKR